MLGQCDTTIPASQTCPAGAGTVNNGGTLSLGNGNSTQTIATRTRCVDAGQTRTVNTLNFFGQNQTNQTFELYVAGNLVINNNFTFSSTGTNNTFRLHILPGGSVTYASNNGVNISANFELINYGTFTASGTSKFTLQANSGSAATIYNAGTMSFHDLTFAGTNSSYIGGDLSTMVVRNELVVNSNTAIIALGEGAALDVEELDTNNKTNSICASGSCAELNIETVGSINNSVTADNEVLLCYGDNPGGTFGNAGNPTPVCPAECPTTVLPVTWVSFKGEQTTEGVELIWQTATEVSNDTFVIESSLEGDTFEEIGTVKGVGTSKQIQTYTWLDDRLVYGKGRYYRIRQIDFDGTTSFSKVIHLSLKPESGRIISVSPNPVKGNDLQFYLSVSKTDIHLQLTDLLGQTVAKKTIQPSKTGKLQHWSTNLKGIYLLTAYIEGLPAQQLKVLFQ
ncbi:MAG: T9SS type A sorting domain-containing protein [Bacteroidota bacterium]